MGFIQKGMEDLHTKWSTLNCEFLLDEFEEKNTDQESKDLGDSFPVEITDKKEIKKFNKLLKNLIESVKRLKNSMLTSSFALSVEEPSRGGKIAQQFAEKRLETSNNIYKIIQKKLAQLISELNDKQFIENALVYEKLESVKDLDKIVNMVLTNYRKVKYHKPVNLLTDNGDLGV